MKDHLLIIRFSALGDIAMTVPVVASLARQHPELRITVLSRPFARVFFDGLAPEPRQRHRPQPAMPPLFGLRQQALPPWRLRLPQEHLTRNGVGESREGVGGVRVWSCRGVRMNNYSIITLFIKANHSSPHPYNSTPSPPQHPKTCTIGGYMCKNSAIFKCFICNIEEKFVSLHPIFNPNIIYKPI